MKLSDKLTQLNITLPSLSGPFGAYIPAKQSGNLLFIAGQLPMKDGKLLAQGHIPSQCTVDQARLGAHQCVINALAAAQNTLGDIDRLKGVVRVGAFVNSDDDFTQQPQVANAASELLLELFGDSGRHVRAAVASNTLPLGTSIEIEFVFEL